jgi:hypothetical protein
VVDNRRERLVGQHPLRQGRMILFAEQAAVEGRHRQIHVAVVNHLKERRKARP